MFRVCEVLNVLGYCASYCTLSDGGGHVGALSGLVVRPAVGVRTVTTNDENERRSELHLLPCRHHRREWSTPRPPRRCCCL